MTFGPASIRNVLRIVDFFLIGPIMIASSKRHQRLGDKLAGTVVLRSRQTHTGPVAKEPAAAAAAPSPAAESKAGQAPDGGEHRGDGFPWVTWGPRRTMWGLLAGLALAALFAPLLVLPFDPDLDSTAGILVAQGLLAITLTGTALYFAREPGPVGVREALARLGWRRFKPSHIAIGFGVLVAYYISVAIYASFVVEPSQDDIGGDLGLDEGPLAATMAVLLIVIAAPLAEESFFRGFVFAGLRSRLSLWPAAIVSGIVFGAIHAPSGPTTVVPLALLGVALAFLYDHTGSLWPPIILHAFNNALALAVSA
jgi:membrane protease YdiL (CAAX protease family)